MPAWPRRLWQATGGRLVSLLRAGPTAPGFQLFRSRAHNQALALLFDHLSDRQRQQFANLGCFDVIGSDTGKRYRIYRQRPSNIHELSGEGRVVRLWCFHPVGNLPMGDVLLAQKMALELFENEALALANFVRAFRLMQVVP